MSQDDTTNDETSTTPVINDILTKMSLPNGDGGLDNVKIATSLIADNNTEETLDITLTSLNTRLTSVEEGNLDIDFSTLATKTELNELTSTVETNTTNISDNTSDIESINSNMDTLQEEVDNNTETTDLFKLGGIVVLETDELGILDLTESNTTDLVYTKNIIKRELYVESDTTIKLVENVRYEFGDYKFTSNNDVTIEPTIDTGTKENGKDYSLYIVNNGVSYNFLYSLSSSNPEGYDNTNSLRIGGFHTLCVATGDLSINAGMEEDHPLTNKSAGIILPASIWDRNHRPRGTCLPDGMVYSQKSDCWSDIYLASGTGYDIKSEYGATHTVSRNFAQFMNDFRLVGKEFLSDEEFVDFSIGSNQETVIVGAVDKSTVGGWSDTTGRRMVSIYGNEEMCGYLWQWIKSAGGRNSSGSWSSLSISMGSEYESTGLLAGGGWSYGSYCGSFCRSGANVRSLVFTYIGGRGRCASHVLRLND